MTGMEMLLKNALTAVFKAMGVTGEEIVQKFEELKTAIPAFAQQAQARLTDIDNRLTGLQLDNGDLRHELNLMQMKLDAIPAFAQQAQARLESIDTRLKKLEEEFTLVHMKLDALLKIDSDPHTLPAGTGAATNGKTEWPVLGGDHAAVEDGKWLATNAG